MSHSTRILRWILAATALSMLGACGAQQATPAAPPATSAGPAPTAPSGAVFEDRFDGAALDTGRWSAPAKPGLITVAAGALTLAVGPPESNAGVEDRIEARTSEPFRTLDATMTIADATKPGPGGGAIVITENSGRTHQIFFGPSADGPSAGVLVCTRAECSGYDDYEPPKDYARLTPGRPVALHVEDRGGDIQFSIDGKQAGSVPAADTTGLKGMAVTVYGAEGETWTITLDDLVLRS